MIALLSWNHYESEPEPDARPGERALGRVANGLASAIHTLLPASSAAVVVVGAATEWQLLAQEGPADLSSTWRHAVASHMREGDPSHEGGEFLIAPFSAVARHILLVLALGPEAQSPSRSRVIVQPLLDAGGILLDRSLATTRLDLPYHRTIEEELESLTRWRPS